jgi:hypothetical protein
MDSPNWYEVRSMTKYPERRAYHSTFVSENKLYVYGGEDLNEGVRNTIYSIDLSFLGQNPGKIGAIGMEPNWQPVTIANGQKIASPYLTHHTTVVYNGYAYMCGGLLPSGRNNSEIYKFEFHSSKWAVAR